MSAKYDIQALGTIPRLCTYQPPFPITRLGGKHMTTGSTLNVDRAYTTCWPKASGYINPYWHVREEKPANIIF